MSHSRHIFLDTATATEVVLPITPSSWTWGAGNDVVLTTAEQIGDINLPGRRTLTTQTITGILPVYLHQFCEPEAVADPSYYINLFEAWAKDGTILRYIISDTTVNAEVIIQGFEWSASKRNGMIDYTITLREYEAVLTTAVAVAEDTTTVREVESETTSIYHTVVSGDTLSSLCLFYYGSSSYYSRVAAHNGIANPNLIYVGDIIEFPPLDSLTTSTVTTSTTTTALIAETPNTVKVSIYIQGSTPGKTTIVYTDGDGATQTIKATTTGTHACYVLSGGRMQLTRTEADGSYFESNGLKITAVTYTVTPTSAKSITVQY